MMILYARVLGCGHDNMWATVATRRYAAGDVDDYDERNAMLCPEPLDSERKEHVSICDLTGRGT